MRRVARNAMPSRPLVGPAHLLTRRWRPPPTKGRPTRCRPSSRLTGRCAKHAFPYTLDLRHVDGGVHALFTITGRTDAARLQHQQDNFCTAAQEGDLIFRIPTPVFGGGLIEAISDAAIIANMNSNLGQKHNLGIGGVPNTSGNDGTITRFGWKAQNKSLEVFSGEAYNVEVGVTNELFNTERDQTLGCQFNATPEDSTNFDLDGTPLPSDVVRFTMFMQFLDQPQPGPGSGSTQHGGQLFSQIGCALCHTPSFTTGPSSVAALSNVQANLYSDILLHHMGPNSRRQREPRCGGGRPVPYRTAMGIGPAHLLPARWPH